MSTSVLQTQNLKICFLTSACMGWGTSGRGIPVVSAMIAFVLLRDLFDYIYILTHLRLASLLWDIGKQHSPRCDAAERGVPSGAILFAWRNFIKNE